MKKLINKSSLSASALIFGLSALLVTGCGDDDNEGPSDPPVIGEEAGVDDSDDSDTDESDDTVEAGASTDEDATDATDEDATDEDAVDGGAPSDEDGGTEPTPGDDGGATDTDGPSVDGGTPDTDASVEPPVEECVENDDECVSCPTEPEDFLQQCTGADCAPFDNAERLGKFVEGEPLPEVP